MFYTFSVLCLGKKQKNVLKFSVRFFVQNYDKSLGHEWFTKGFMGFLGY